MEILRNANSRFVAKLTWKDGLFQLHPKCIEIVTFDRLTQVSRGNDVPQM